MAEEKDFTSTEGVLTEDEIEEYGRLMARQEAIKALVSELTDDLAYTTQELTEWWTNVRIRNNLMDGSLSFNKHTKRIWLVNSEPQQAAK